MWRTESTRQRREEEAHTQSTIDNGPAEEVWQELSPLPDEAMNLLGQTDRDAVAVEAFTGGEGFGGETAANGGFRARRELFSAEFLLENGENREIREKRETGKLAAQRSGFFALLVLAPAFRKSASALDLN